ncbi:BatD family protein [bacterium]|nr:BatD family protein [bacterium]MDB4693697.1 BatD family protein [Akkermansiaceae bacterium]
MTHMLRILFSLLLAHPLWAQTPALKASLQSNFLVEGEETLLTLTVKDVNISGWPATPQISPLTLRQESNAKTLRNHRISNSFTYRVSSVKTGTFTIPPFRLGTVQSSPLTLHVMKRSLLKKEAFILNGETFPYYSGVFIANSRPYLGETQMIEAKIYLPSGIRIEDPRFADFEKKDIVAWRFDSIPGSGGFRSNDQTFSSVSYRSAVTPLKEEAISVGPGSVEPLINFKVSRRGRLFWERQILKLHFPLLPLDVQALPKPAPPGFSGAVGNFRPSSQVEGLDVTVGDPITVELQVSGTGNLDQLGPPRLLDEEGAFKQYDISKKPQGSERRSSTGVVEFSQVIRPERVTTELPPYELVFFDPVLKQYRSALTPALPLTVKPSDKVAAASSTAQSDPAQAFLTPRTYVIPATPIQRPVWLWQIVPALIGLFLLIKKLRPAVQAKQQQSQISKEFEREFENAKSSKTRTELYRQATQFIDRWSPRSGPPEGAAEIIKIRDEICFSPDAQEEPILPKEKSAVLSLLRQLAPLILLSLLFLPETLKADRQSRLDEAVTNPTPEAFYNLGIEEEKAENSAAAALYFYRHEAYAEKSETLEPLLRRIEAIRRVEARDMEMISLVPRTFFRQCGFAFLWGLGLTALVLIARLRGWAPFFIPLTLVAGALWLLAEFYYPKDVSFEPLRELSVVMESQDLRDAPFDGSATSRKIPAGSIGKIRGTSGEWTFLELPGGSKGWLPREIVTPIAGRQLWNPPTSQKD